MFYSQPTGTGGAGMSGLLQGLIAGKQSRESTQRMDMLQTQFDQQQDSMERGQFNEKMYNIREIQKNGGNVADSLVGMNDWMSKSKNFSEEPQFNVGNWDTLKDSEGQFTTEGLNKYRSDTGEDFVPGESDKNMPIMFGDKLFDFDTFGAGASNFQTYAKEKDLATKLLQAKITKEGKSTTKPSEIKRHATLANKENLTPTEATELASLENKLKLNKGSAMSNMLSPESQGIIKNLQVGKDTTEAERTQLMTDQVTAGQTYTKYQDMADKVTLNNNLGRSYNELKKLYESGDSESGWSESMRSDILKTVDSKEFKNMTEDDQRATLTKSVRNSKALARIFEIIKLESGAAFTDEEFAKRLQTLVGGDLDKINDQTLLTTLGDYTSGKYKDTRQALSNISSKYSGDKAELLHNLNQGSDLFKAPGLDFVKPGGDVSGDQAIANETARQATETANTAKQITEGAVDASGIKEVPGYFAGKIDALKDWAFGSDAKSSTTGPTSNSKYSKLSDAELKAIDYKTVKGEDLKQLRQEVAKRYAKRFK